MLTEREKKLANALEAIRAELAKPRDYRHAPAIAESFDKIDDIATLTLAQNVWEGGDQN